MKSHKEVKEACDLMGALISGHLPIRISPEDKKLLEAQYQVLCFVLECEGNDSFQNSVSSLKELLSRIGFHQEGESQVFVE